MEQELIQLGYLGTAGIILWIIYKIAALVLGKKRNGLEKEVKLIGENHLHEILGAIKEQTRDNNDWHGKQYQALCEIKGLLQK